MLELYQLLNYKLNDEKSWRSSKSKLTSFNMVKKSLNDLISKLDKYESINNKLKDELDKYKE
jgi:hypothetical protein